MKCPFLEEVVVRYCQAYPIRKMIPCSSEENTCVGKEHFQCETFKEMARANFKMEEIAMTKVESKSQEYPSLKASSNFFPPYWSQICRHSNCPACIYRNQCYAAEGKWLKEPVLVSGFVMQRGLHFSRAHTWAKTRKVEAVRVGFDDFAQKLLGNITKVDLPEKGSTVKQGENSWSVKCGSRSADLLSPIDGEVIEVNQKLFKDTSLINKDPYGNGWVLTLKPYHLEKNLRLLYQGDQAKTWLENDADRLHRRVEKDLGVTVADGGQLIQAISKRIPAKEWKKLVHDFLQL
jgi:glycine cleavage system H protein